MIPSLLVLWLMPHLLRFVHAMSYPHLRLPSRAQAAGAEASCQPHPYPTAAAMNYVDPSVEIAHMHRDTTGQDGNMEASWTDSEVAVINARKVLPPPKLHTSGFELVNDSNGLMTQINFFDADDVVGRYYKHCQELLKNTLGPEILVKSFDHNIRVFGSNALSGDCNLRNALGSAVLDPAGIVHGDYTAASAKRRVQDLASPPKANDVWSRATRCYGEPLLDPALVREVIDGKRRFALVNVWRNIDPDRPVLSCPLACIDAITLHRRDLRTLQIHYIDRVGENFLACHSDAHKWMFYPEMEIGEALLIKQWDSAGDFAQGADQDSRISSLCLHSAFLTENAYSLPSRKSIEVRCVCIW